MLALIGAESFSSCGSDITVDRTVEYAMGKERDLDALNDRLEQFRPAGEVPEFYRDGYARLPVARPVSAAPAPAAASRSAA